MAFDIETTLKNIQALVAKELDLQAPNVVRIGQLRSATMELDEKLTAAIFMAPDGVDVVQATLQKTIEVHKVVVRLVINLLRFDPEEVELLLARTASKVMEALCGDFDLGATVRNVDVAGQHSDGFGARWGNYAEENGPLWRYVDILVPLIVDDSATLVA